jgi:mannosyltransferase
MGDTGDRMLHAEASLDAPAVAGVARRATALADRHFGRGLAVLAGSALLIAGVAITREGMWNDELQTLAVADRSFGAFLHLLPHRQNGILFDLVIWPVVHLGGTSPFWLRLPSLLASAAAVVLCALVGARLAGRAIGLLAGLFLTLSPFAVYYAQEARPYAFVLFFVLLAAWLLLRAAEQPTAWRFAAYAVSVVLVGYAHDFALLSVLAHPFLLLRARRRVWIGFGVSLATVALLFLPAVFFIPDDWAKTAFFWVRPPREYLRPTARFAFGSLATLAIAAAVLGCGAVALWRRLATGSPVPFDARLPAFAVALAAAPFGVLVLYSLHQPVYVPRYVIEGAAGIALALAAAVAVLPRRLGVASGVVVAIALLFSAIRVDMQQTKQDWPGVAAAIGVATPQRPVLLLGDGLQSANGLFYYSSAYGIDRRHLLYTTRDQRRLPPGIVVAAQGDELATLRRVAAGGGAFWLVESGYVSSDARSQVNAFLNGCATHATRQFREISLVGARGCR